MAIIYKSPRKPMGDLFQNLLSPENVSNFSGDIGNALGNYFQQQQELRNRQMAMQQDFQQQQALQEAKERARAQQGAAFAGLFKSPTEERPQEDDFGSRKWEDIAAEAGKTGLFSAKEIGDIRKQWIDEKKHFENKQHQEKTFKFQQEQAEKREKERAEEFAEKKGENIKRHQEKARESQISEEKDQRKFDNLESQKVIKQGESAEKRIKEFEAIKKLSRSKETSVGLPQQLLNALGLGKYNASSPTQVLNKMTADIINDNPNSKAGIAMRNAIKEGQITSELNQDAIGFISDYYGSLIKKEVLLKNEIQKIKKESRQKGEKDPLHIIDIARDNIQNKLDKIDDEQLGLVNKFVGESAAQGPGEITIPKGAVVGDIMTNPDTKEKVIYLGPKMGVRDLKEYQGALKELESDLPATENKGRKLVNDDLNLAFVSDGRSWKPLE